MSDAGADDGVVQSADGVTVRKLLEPDEFSTPAIAFEVTSERSEAVVLRLVDPLPDGASIDEVGFHPDYGSQYWTADEDRLTFEYRLDPGEAYTTVYGLRADDAAPFLSDFKIVAAAVSADDSPLSDVSDVVSSEDSHTVRNLIADAETGATEPDAAVDGSAEAEAAMADSGDAVDLDGVDEPAEKSARRASGDAEAEPVDADADLGDSPLDTADATEPATESPGGVAGSGEADVSDQGEEAVADPLEGDAGEIDEPAASVSDGGDEAVARADEGGDPAASLTESNTGAIAKSGIVAAIAAEVRDGTASEEDLETVTEALNRTRPSVESRIRYLQNEVSDLAPYVDALEAFIDEHGSARDLLGELRTGLESLESDIAEIDERTAAHGEALDDLENALDGIRTEVDDLSSDVDGVGDDVDDVEEAVDDLRDDLGSVDDDIADLEDDVTDVEELVSEIDAWRDRFRTVFAPDDSDDTDDE